MPADLAFGRRALRPHTGGTAAFQPPVDKPKAGAKGKGRGRINPPSQPTVQVRILRTFNDLNTENKERAITYLDKLTELQRIRRTDDLIRNITGGEDANLPPQEPQPQKTMPPAGIGLAPDNLNVARLPPEQLDQFMSSMAASAVVPDGPAIAAAMAQRGSYPPPPPPPPPPPGGLMPPPQPRQQGRRRPFAGLDSEAVQERQSRHYVPLCQPSELAAHTALIAGNAAAQSIHMSQEHAQAMWSHSPTSGHGAYRAHDNPFRPRDSVGDIALPVGGHGALSPIQSQPLSLSHSQHSLPPPQQQYSPSPTHQQYSPPMQQYSPPKFPLMQVQVPGQEPDERAPPPFMRAITGMYNGLSPQQVKYKEQQRADWLRSLDEQCKERERKRKIEQYRKDQQAMKDEEEWMEAGPHTWWGREGAGAPNHSIDKGRSGAPHPHATAFRHAPPVVRDPTWQKFDLVIEQRERQGHGPSADQMVLGGNYAGGGRARKSAGSDNLNVARAPPVVAPNADPE